MRFGPKTRHVTGDSPLHSQLKIGSVCRLRARGLIPYIGVSEYISTPVMLVLRARWVQKMIAPNHKQRKDA
jgi:hypothetical protein